MQPLTNQVERQVSSFGGAFTSEKHPPPQEPWQQVRVLTMLARHSPSA